MFTAFDTSVDICWYRAYKLGKKRWSYNQCEVVLLQEGSTGTSKLSVVEAVHDPDPAIHSDIAGSQVSIYEYAQAAAVKSTNL